MSLSLSDYKRDFGLEPADEAPGESSAAKSSKAEKALNTALEIRKFEIGLYWTRAAYFWTFIGISLAAYGAELASSDQYPKKAEKLLVVSCIGFVFSLAWYFVNRASKFWQENWEKHVDLLEDGVLGPLYKTVISRAEIKQKRLLDRPKWLLEPYPFSVSKINQFLSLFVTCLFILMMIGAIVRGFGGHPISFPWFVGIAEFFTVVSIGVLVRWCGTDKILAAQSSDPTAVAERRSTRLRDDCENQRDERMQSGGSSTKAGG